MKENPQYGDPIKKELIPEEFKKLGIKYNLKENKALQCSQIDALHGFYIRRLQQCELVIAGYSKPDIAEIEVEFQYGAVLSSKMVIKG